MGAKNIIFYCCCLITMTGISQNKVPENLDSLQANPTKYMSPMEYAFMLHEDTPWMLKGGFNSNSNFFLEFERRIAGSFSANFSIDDALNSPINRYYNISTKYYYNSKKLREEKNTPFNLSGSYLELGAGLSSYSSQTFNQLDSFPFSVLETQRNLSTRYFVKWGLQRRYLKTGYVDIGLRASYTTNYQELDFFSINSETSIGLAFARDKKILNKDLLCSVVKCLESEKYAVKSNVSDLFYGIYSDRIKTFRIRPEVDYEIKIKQSKFSINNSLSVGFGVGIYNEDFYTSINATNNTRISFDLNFTLETRYYYNLRNRIKKGKTGNGLSANYIALGLYNNYNRNGTANSNELFTNENYGFLQPQIAIGFQRFVGDHFFYDFSIGYRPEVLKPFESEFNNNYYDEFFVINKIGYRF